MLQVIVELAFEKAMRRSEILKLTSQDIFSKQRFLGVVDGISGAFSPFGPLGIMNHQFICAAPRANIFTAVKTSRD